MAEEESLFLEEEEEKDEDLVLRCVVQLRACRRAKNWVVAGSLICMISLLLLLFLSLLLLLLLLVAFFSLPLLNVFFSSFFPLFSLFFPSFSFLGSQMAL